MLDSLKLIAVKAGQFLSETAKAIGQGMEQDAHAKRLDDLMIHRGEALEHCINNDTEDDD